MWLQCSNISIDTHKFGAVLATFLFHKIVKVSVELAGFTKTVLLGLSCLMEMVNQSDPCNSCGQDFA